MVEVTVSAEDLEVIKSILIQYKQEGNTNPLLPMEVDVNGDGIVDSFGLDADENVVVVPGVKLEDTVYESTGGTTELGSEVES
jgi:hypothetical protein